jgi:hypothetical protein
VILPSVAKTRRSGRILDAKGLLGAERATDQSSQYGPSCGGSANGVLFDLNGCVAPAGRRCSSRWEGGFISAFYQIDKQRHLVLSFGEGVLTKEDIQGHMDRIVKDPDFDPSFSQLVDFTKVTGVGFGPDEIRMFAERNIFSPNARRAFVVVDDLHFGLARMFEILRELKGEKGIRIFRTREEAMDWILVGNIAS